MSVELYCTWKVWRALQELRVSLGWNSSTLLCFSQALQIHNSKELYYVFKSLGTRSSKVSKRFHTRKAVAKSQIFWLQSCFIHIFLIWTEVVFIQGVSGVSTSRLLDTDDLKMALRTRKVSEALEKRGPGPFDTAPIREFFFNCLKVSTEDSHTFS